MTRDSSPAGDAEQLNVPSKRTQAAEIERLVQRLREEDCPSRWDDFITKCNDERRSVATTIETLSRELSEARAQLRADWDDLYEHLATEQLAVHLDEVNALRSELSDTKAALAAAEAVVAAARHLVADALAVRDGGVRDGLGIRWASIDKTRDAIAAYDSLSAPTTPASAVEEKP